MEFEDTIRQIKHADTIRRVEESDKLIGDTIAMNEKAVAQQLEKSQYVKNFSKIIEFSEKQLLDARSRMPIEQQGWAKGTANEERMQ